MKSFYVSAHSKIGKKNQAFGDIPPNTYVIMTTVCGRYSYVKQNGFEKKWLGTAEGVQALTDIVTKTQNVTVNGKRIFRPGEVGPVVDQLLSFNRLNKNLETFFLGITEAPTNALNLQRSANVQIRLVPKNMYIDLFHKLNNFLLEKENYSFLSEDVAQMEKNDLVYLLKDMFSRPSLGDGVDIATDQLLRALRSPAYTDRLLDGAVQIRGFIHGDIRMSNMLKTHGPGIYVIDACRAIRKTTESDDGQSIRIARRKKQGKVFPSVTVPLGPEQFKESLRGKTRKEAYNIINRYNYFQTTGKKMRQNESVQTEVI